MLIGEAVDTCRNDNYSQWGLKHWNRGCCELIIKTSCDLTERFPLCLITQGGSHSLPSTDNLFLHTKLHAPNYTHFLHSKLLLNMATPTPASESPSGEGTINVPRSDCSSGIDPKCLYANITYFTVKCPLHSTHLAPHYSAVIKASLSHTDQHTPARTPFN